MQCRFVNRERELEALDRAFEGRPGLMVVYGRRRVGKTRLIVEWLGRRSIRSVYYMAHLTSHTHNLTLLAEKASKQLGSRLLARLQPTSLDSLLELLAREGAEVIVLDEFTFWVRAAPRVLSELQEFVDHVLPETSLLLVVSGSLVGVMERSVLGGGSPLYARARWRLRLEELPYRALRSFVPDMPAEDRVRLYSLVGGIPFYLCQVAGARDIVEAVERLILTPASPLQDEKDLLLREELRDPHAYNAILSALARGYDTPARIAPAAGLDPSHVHKYLNVLEHLGFVERRTPLFKRRGRYRIRDPILRTWYSLVEPVLELLELGLKNEARREILARLDTLTAPTWEELVRSHLLEAHAAEGYNVAGFLEHKGEELDVAVLDTKAKRAIVAEAKWSTLTLGEAERLRRRAEAKAARLLPKGYTVEEAYVAVRRVEGARGELPSWIITPERLEGGG